MDTAAKLCCCALVFALVAGVTMSLRFVARQATHEIAGHYRDIHAARRDVWAQQTRIAERSIPEALRAALLSSTPINAPTTPNPNP